MGVVQVGVFLGGSCPVRNFPGGSFRGKELSRWDLSWLGIFFGGRFPGGNCLVGIIWVAIFRVGALTLPFFWFQTYYNKLSRHEQARWWEKYLSKLSLLKHTCSWRDNLLYYEYWIDKQKYLHVVKYI